MLYSVSRVINRKTPQQMQTIQNTRSEWEPRGNTVHACLEHWLTTGEVCDGTDYNDWVFPLLADQVWNMYNPVAVEHSMCDTHNSIAGRTDFILSDGNMNFIIGDLKTLSGRGRKRDISAQLGGYVDLFKLQHEGCNISKCIAVWAKPGETEVEVYDTNRCHKKYIELREQFLRENHHFDF